MYRPLASLDYFETPYGVPSPEVLCFQPLPYTLAAARPRPVDGFAQLLIP